MMYLIVEQYNPELHTGTDNILGVLKSREDAENLIEFYCYDTGFDPDFYQIVEVPVLTAVPPL